MAKRESNLWRNILNIATIISITITVLKLGMTGKIPPEWIAYIMIFCVLILALRSKVVKVLTVLVSLYLFAQTYASNNQELKYIISMILCLAGMMVGIYIILGGWRRK